MRVRELKTEETIDLRHRVLRPNQPLSACYYPQDGAAKHFGIFEGDLLVSLVTAHPEDYKLFSSTGPGHWRIRGMATEPEFQGKGYGSGVLEGLLKWGQAEKVPLIWCNARERAIPFYLKHGFTIESELFEIEGIGPHKVMKRDIG